MSSQAAIVRGAAIRGLEGTVPDTVICRRHYGVETGQLFRPGVDVEKNAYYMWGEKLSAGYMSWIIHKVCDELIITLPTCMVNANLAILG